MVRRRKKIRSGRVMSVFLLCAIMLLGDAGMMTIQAAPSTGRAANLVVIVRYQGDTVGDDDTGYNTPYTSQISGAPTTYWGLLQRRFNGENDTFAIGSFREYLSRLSGGAHQVESLFPQTVSGERVEYITLDKTLAEYQGSNEISLVAEVAQKLTEKYPTYDGTLLDRDGDGAIDNLMILASVPKTGQLTPHTTNAGNNYTFAGKTIGYYNILETCTTTLSSGTFWDSFDIATAAHEYVHTFGVPDYYRTSGMNGTPVGMWDLMAGSLGRPSLLATTRENIGWAKIAQKTATSSTYTLYDMDSAYANGGKSQAYKFYTPFSSSEYFVVEYRKPGKKYSADLDQNMSGAGLIVYRVNPAYATDGNLRGNDYIYVFRPDDTGGNASAGDITKAAAGMPTYISGRQSIGSEDLSKTIVDNAICYSDGRNSGMTISVTAQTDDSITFDVTFPDYANMNLWETVTSQDGTTPLSTMNASATQLATDGNAIYVLAQNTNSSTVLQYDGANWTNLGKPIDNVSSSVSIESCNGSLYALISDYRNNCSVLKKYSGNAWKEITTMNAYATNHPVLGVIGDKLATIVAKDNKNPQLYLLENDSWKAVGPQLNVSYLVSPVLFSYNGFPALAYGDFTERTTSVMVYKNDQWTSTHKNTDAYAKKIVVKTTGDHVYLLSNESTGSAKLTTMDMSGGVTETVMSSLGSNLLDIGLTAGKQNLYYAIVTADGKVNVYSSTVADPTDTTMLGSTVYSPAFGTALGRMDGILYCASTPQSDGTMDVRRYQALDDEIPSTPEPTPEPEPEPEPKPEPTPKPNPEPTPTPVERTYNAVYNGVDYSSVFDPYYYADQYADLKQAYGYDCSQLLQHFINYGMSEGRQAKASFNATSYRLQYSDLRRAYGNDLKPYYMHYLQWGRSEGRQGTGCNVLQNGLTRYDGIDYAAVYDYNTYVSRYSDVFRAYGYDDQAVLLHFIHYGMNEGRIAKASFDVTSYRLQYSDLRRAYGNNLKSYYLHYLQWGRQEGRKGSGCIRLQGAITTLNGTDYGKVYDYQYYIDKNPDVFRAYGYDDQAVLAHFVNYGMKEGRIAEASFVVNNYKARYADLRQAYGNNTAMYYNHYINWGYKEGRKGN